MATFTTITKPVSLARLAQTLGTSLCDVKNLCTHSKINKWAYYKPIMSGEVIEVTDDERRARVNLGELDGLVVSRGGTLAALTDTRTAFNYNRPDKVFRISDFCNPGDNGLLLGYLHAKMDAQDDYTSVIPVTAEFFGDAIQPSEIEAGAKNSISVTFYSLLSADKLSNLVNLGRFFGRSTDVADLYPVLILSTREPVNHYVIAMRGASGQPGTLRDADTFYADLTMEKSGTLVGFPDISTESAEYTLTIALVGDIGSERDNGNLREWQDANVARKGVWVARRLTGNAVQNTFTFVNPYVLTCEAARYGSGASTMVAFTFRSKDKGFDKSFFYRINSYPTNNPNDKKPEKSGSFKIQRGSNYTATVTVTLAELAGASASNAYVEMEVTYVDNFATYVACRYTGTV